MCVACSGSVPHPSVQELPLFYSLIQLGVTLALAYWFLFKLKLQKIYTDILWFFSAKSTAPREGKEKHMNAAVCESYGDAKEVLSVKQVVKPQPRAKEILIKVHASAVNSADVRLRSLDAGEGVFGFFMRIMMRFVIGFRGPRRKILGSVVAGIVTEVGAQVENFTIGDEIFALTGLSLGGHAEYCVLPVTRAIALKPVSATFQDGAAIAFGGSTALYFLRKAQVSSAKTILVYGATGSVGTSVLQIAKSYGLKVSAVCGSDGKELSTRLGADLVFDYQQPGWLESENTYDIVFDSVGKTNKKQIEHLLSPKGTYVTVGGLDVAQEDSSDLQELADMYEKGHLRGVIDKTYSLSEIANAHEYVETGRKKGNVVIEVV